MLVLSLFLYIRNRIQAGILFIILGAVQKHLKNKNRHMYKNI